MCGSFPVAGAWANQTLHRGLSKVNSVRRLVPLLALVTLAAVAATTGFLALATRCGHAEVRWQRDEQGAVLVRREVWVSLDGREQNHGQLDVFWPSGARRSIGHWRRGEKDGHFEHWHPNGQLAKQADYRGGQLQGPVRTWSHAGQLLSGK